TAFVDGGIEVIDGGVAYVDGGTAFVDGGVEVIDGGVAYLDGGVTYVDGGLAFVDGGVEVIDGGVAYLDGGVTYVDGGLAFVDGGVEVIDGGLAFIDGGLAYVDGGLAYVDGGVEVIDGGVAYVDGGIAYVDGGIAAVDAGGVDAGALDASAPDAEVDGGVVVTACEQQAECAGGFCNRAEVGGPVGICEASFVTSWSIGWGGAGADRAVAVGTDGAGNAYVLGSFDGATQVAGVSLTGGSDASYVASFDPSGALRWVVPTDASLRAMAVSDDGTVAVTGSFSGTITLGAQTIVAVGEMNVLVAALSGTGAVSWASGHGTAFTWGCLDVCPRNEGLDVELDAAGNVYVAGVHASAISFGGTTLAARTDANQAFFASFSAAGAHRWSRVRAIGGASSGVAIAWRPTGGLDALLVPSFSTSYELLSIDVASGAQTSVATFAQSSGLLNGTTLRDLAFGAFPSTSGLYFSANVDGTMTVVPGFLTITAESFVHDYVAQQAPNVRYLGLDVRLPDVGLDPIYERVSVAASFTGTHAPAGFTQPYGPVPADFVAIPPITSAGGRDALILTINAFGSSALVVEHQRFGGPLNDEAVDLVERSGHRYVLGTFQGTAGTLTSAGSDDVFLLRQQR
ncbi:hypothetical protein L6R52_10885, partial [Myxococcota bacterium]|nr:hypothetical protein [Myxococcota bacterium]